MANPFQTLAPVKKQDHFYGYKEQKHILIQKINEAANSNIASHIAILGSKATGKTSFLNFIKDYSNENDFICIKPIRVDFFHKPYDLFKSIFDEKPYRTNNYCISAEYEYCS